MEAWDRDNVPGVASQRTRLESAKVVDEMIDDHRHKFVWKVEGRFGRGNCFWGCVTEQDIDHGFASIPNDTNQELYPCGVDNTEVRTARMHRGVIAPDTEDIGVFERTRFVVVVDMPAGVG